MDYTLAGIFVAVAHLLGMASSWDAVMTGRTPQGTIAWIFSLVTIPYVSVPLYWVFGRRRYQGYVDARRAGHTSINVVAEDLRGRAGEHVTLLDEDDRHFEVLEQLVSLPFTHGNDAGLLVDGKDTFDAVFEAIEKAERYVLVQFFIVRDDDLGRALVEKLCERAAAGVEVAFLYDEIGSRELSRRFLREARAAGVRLQPFKTTRGPRNRFQLNFRNHRKIVLVDGEVAFIGGLNVGVEYLGLGRMGAWRDSFVRLAGPVVHGVQLAFLEDWHWATDEVPDWCWEPRSAPGADRVGLVLPTGPADPVETASLVFVTLFGAATERLWITTPYFVFDSQVLGALQLAALRGVDVRIIIPEIADYRIVGFAAWTYFEEVLGSGVRLYRYRDGFMHQKLVIVDDRVVMIGTKNLDNRSQRLNFELSALFIDRELTTQASELFERDLAASTEVQEGALARQPLWFRFAARAARLFAPIL